MKRLIISLLLLSLVGVASGSTCDKLEEMYRAYEYADKDWANTNQAMYGLYSGTIRGWIDRDMMVDQQTIINYPKGFKYSHAEEVVGQWLQKHPEKWHMRFRGCIYLALHEAYGGRDLQKK